MSFDTDVDPVDKAIDLCSQTQFMIDFKARHLDGLRTQCATSQESTQQEIRETEGKLIRLFGRQLVAKAKLKIDNVPAQLKAYPKTDQWLRIVNINNEAVQGLLSRDLNLDTMLDMSPSEVQKLMEGYNSSTEDIHKLNQALANLKLWTKHQLNGDNKGNTMDLHWSSYKSTSNSPCGGSSPKFQRPSTSSLPPDTCLNPQSPPTPPESPPPSPFRYPSPGERRRFTPPPTPPLVNRPKGKFPTTPPPQKKNKLYPEAFHPLKKSRSHESQLANRVNNIETDLSKLLKKKPNNLTLASSHDAICKRRRSTEGSDAGGGSRGPSGQTSPLMLSPKRSPPYQHLDQVSLPDMMYDIHPQRKNQLSVPPISPKTPHNRSMLHSISHRFTNTFKITTCDYCQKQMFIGYKCKECKFQTKLVMGACDICHNVVILGKVCKYCKFKCHRDCATKAAPACGLPNELVDIFINSLRDGSPNAGRRTSANHTMSLPANEATGIRPATSVPSFGRPDSSSNTSSCNSSTPSSPALNTSSATPPSPSHHSSPCIQVTYDRQFEFPDITDSTMSSMGSVSTYSTMGSGGSYGSYPGITIAEPPVDNSDVVNTNTSNDSDKSDKTLIDSGNSDRAHLLDRVDSQESADLEGLGWQRQNSISVTLKEWDIPYEDLVIGDMVGKGRVGTVYKGNWHGDVAVKMLNMDAESDNNAQLATFKLEVAMLRRTRHDNLVLFMGACMKPPYLGIVTSLCKGQTLYKHIHVRKEKFHMNRTVIIASQIAQGMGYLHAKKIIHKDLKTKNIFLEGGKVVITDFGLFNVTKLCYGNRKGNWLSIPVGWLCYLSPEVIRSLQVGNQHDIDLPFSEASDVYAFGTVWYELLCGEWPFKNQPPEAIIWQVGKGMKQSLSNIQASRDVKDMLMLCWSFKPDDRPDFSQLLKTLERLPKKRWIRSPSHPVHLSRSAESVF